MPSVIYPFGPAIYKASISEKVLNMCHAAIQRIRTDETLNRSYKAGQFTKGTNPMMDFTEEEFKAFDLEVKRHILNYFLELRGSLRMSEEMSKTCLKRVDTMRPYVDHEGESSVWANIQKPGDMHALHHHPGDVSFVMYLQIPSITDEDRACHGGMVAWKYGEYMDFSNEKFAHRPEVGDIIIFPPKCQHFVWPFKNEHGERISIAGNYEFTE